MTLMIEAAAPMLALETKAVADARRIRAALARTGQAFQRFGQALSNLDTVIVNTTKKLANSLQALSRLWGGYFSDHGHYWRDGKIRRNHSYYRQRARDNRARLKIARKAARIAATL